MPSASTSPTTEKPSTPSGRKGLPSPDSCAPASNGGTPEHLSPACLVNPLQVAALDLDLRRIHAVRGDGKELFTQEPSPWAAQRKLQDAGIRFLLCEAASGRIYRDGGGAASNMLRWALFNTWAITVMAPHFHTFCCPSHTWTKGYSLGTRHELCKAQARNKDLRECEAMLFFSRLDPGSWTRWDIYFSAL